MKMFEKFNFNKGKNINELNIHLSKFIQIKYDDDERYVYWIYLLISPYVIWYMNILCLYMLLCKISIHSILYTSLSLHTTMILPVITFWMVILFNLLFLTCEFEHDNKQLILSFSMVHVLFNLIMNWTYHILIY